MLVKRKNWNKKKEKKCEKTWNTDKLNEEKKKHEKGNENEFFFKKNLNKKKDAK